MASLQALARLLTRSADTGSDLTRAVIALSQRHEGIQPPTRPMGDPRSLIAVYRAVQVLTTAAAQLPITVRRAGATITPPAHVAQPDPRMTPGEWKTHMVASLALHGNAYALIERDTDGTILALRPLDPARVFISVNPTTHALRFGVEGRTLTSYDVLHAHLQPARPSEPLGLGPIQAARSELEGAHHTRDYATQWFTGTGLPSGILTGPAAATFEDALKARNLWNGLTPDGTKALPGDNPSRVRVTSKGYDFKPVAITPEDAQWLEARQFDTLQVARLFGIPSTLMLAAPDGGSMTYSNVEQDWIAFTRFTLMAYLRPLEEALTSHTVRGQSVRFNLDGLLRSDTKSRYDSYAIGLANGFLTIDEVRALEDRPPLQEQA